MAYFECEHGKRYYPFGKGGRENLLRALDKTKSVNAANSEEGTEADNNTASALVKRLQECPLHLFPLSNDTSTYTDKGRDADPRRPIVLRNPNAENAKIFSNLADSVVGELFKQLLSAQELPTVSYIDGKGVTLRYFTAHQAIEYMIPPVELRVRDPGSGRLKPDHEKNREKFASAKPMRFESKGNYGVGIIWEDGHHGDIFKFDTLRKIAEECALKKDKK
jgi:DUF971 family protein